MSNMNKIQEFKGAMVEKICEVSLKVFESSNNKCALGFLYEPSLSVELYTQSLKSETVKRSK